MTFTGFGGHYVSFWFRKRKDPFIPGELSRKEGRWKGEGVGGYYDSGKVGKRIWKSVRYRDMEE